LVYRGVRDALFARDLIPHAAENKQDKREAPPQPEKQKITGISQYDRPATPAVHIRETSGYHPGEAHRILSELFQKEKEKSDQKPAFQQESFRDDIIIRPEKEKRFRLIGQLFDTYWLLEYEDWFIMADQHAVHEKILYERTMKSLKNKEATSQQLLVPLLITLNGAQQETLHRCSGSFHSLGFEIEELGGREIRLNAVPDNLFSLSSKELFLSMLDELGEEKISAPDMIDEKVAMMSCKAAVKGNHKLAAEEAESLLAELLKLDNPYTCPHGRPTMIRMSRTDMERKFKRIL